MAAQIVDDRLLQPIVESDAERREGGFQRIRCHQSTQDPWQETHPFTLDHIVDHHFDQPRREQFHGRCTGRGQQCEQRQSAIGAEVVQDAEEGFHKMIN